MSLKDKFSVVLETASMNDEQVGEYCRKHGIYKSDLERWKAECSQAFEEPVSRTDLKQQKTEIKELRQKVSRLEMDCQNKDRQIDKKDKALATYAAQVITMKNFQKLFTDSYEEDETVVMSIAINRKFMVYTETQISYSMTLKEEGHITDSVRL